MKTNQQLKDQGAPHCDWRTFIKYKGVDPIPPDAVLALDTYFFNFVPPGPCIKCGSVLGDDPPSYLYNGRSSFRWGLKYGEGFCGAPNCNWPARAIHENIGPLRQLKMILQYHPGVVTWQDSSSQMELKKS